MLNIDELPTKVFETFERIKNERKHHILLRRGKNCFYVYEATSKFKKDKDKYPRSIAYYLGKIKKDGTFIEAKHRKEETKLGSIDEYLKLKKDVKQVSEIERIMYPDEVDLEILTQISSNGRVAIKDIANVVGRTAPFIKNKLKKLERNYRIKYTVEIAQRPFGLFRYFVLVRFIDKIPDRDKLAKLLESNPMIQFAAFTIGTYNLFIYLFAENTYKLEEDIFNIRSNEIFTNCKSSWTVSYMTYAYGYIPVREQFIDYIGNHFVWHRTRDEPQKPKHKLAEREYIVLKELNENGRINFNKIDEKYNLTSGSSAYAYYQLTEKKIIRRITITMKIPPIKYNAILLLKQLDVRKFIKIRNAYLLNTIQDTPTPLNKYILTGDVGAPYGILRIVPIFNDRDLTNIINEINNLNGGIEIKYLIITDILVGTLGYRKIDNTLSTQYKILQEEALKTKYESEHSNKNNSNQNETN
ncbi:MAG: Lrp/AsnC family transcriptional regulator [Candidatus Micrarchaeia archaeon]